MEQRSICLINDSFPPVTDGVANAVVNYAKNLTQDGKRATVVTPAYPDADDTQFGFPVVRYPSVDLTKLVGYHAGLPFSSQTLEKLVEQRFDLIHCHCPVTSAMLARALRDRIHVPLVFTYHTKFDIDIANAIKGKLLQEEAKKVLVDNITACDEVWTVSHGAGENLKSLGYQGGYPDGTVKPTGDVTRAEVAAILYRVMDADCVKTYETTRCSFSDVVRGDWFNLYVATLENAGVIVDTRTNGKFRPNEAITRAELAAMLAQFADIKSAANSFNDVSARHWASDEIAVCAKMGWINGYPDGSFRPDATITRAEMMAMINRALGRTPKSADDLLSGMKTWRDNANVNAWYYLDVQEATNSHTYTKSGTHETWKKLR